MSKLKILSRILCVLSPFFLPWWLALIIALAALFFYEKFYEIVAMGFICDVLYASTHSFVGAYGFTLCATVLLGIVMFVKRRLIMY